MTSGLEAILVRNIRKRTRIVRCGQKHELSNKCPRYRIFMAFQAGDLIVSRGLPLFVIGSDKMAYITILGIREYGFQRINIYSPKYCYEDQCDYYDFLAHNYLL